MHRATAILAFVLAAALGGTAGAQMRMTAPAPAAFISPVNAATLSGLPRITLSATDEKGHTDTYSGVSLHDLIVKLGAPTGEPVRGKAMLSYIVVNAADNYHVIFALPELDPSYTDHVALIADMVDGKAFADAGPYRLIVPFEKRQARWVRNMTSVGLQNASAFEVGR